MDILDDIFDTLDLRGVLYFRTDFTPPWAITVPDLTQAARFHLVLQGHCDIEIMGEGRVSLGPGDLVMIPRGRSHVLADKPGRNARPLETVLSDAGYDGRGVLTVGEPDAAATTHMLCGHYSFRSLAEHPILRALPGYIVITTTMRMAEPWLDELLRMMAQRVFSQELGSNSSIKRLSEIVFTEVIRAGIARDEALLSVLAGFRDPQIGRALESVHNEPEKAWTVASLAKEAGMSRSAFAERFRHLVGVAPMAYLSDWRLQKALAMLESSRKPIQQIAAETGYLSPAAFSRAFSSKFGIPPTDHRRALAQ